MGKSKETHTGKQMRKKYENTRTDEKKVRKYTNTSRCEKVRKRQKQMRKDL